MGGKGSIKMNESEIVRTILSKLTQAPYVVTPPREDDIPKRPRWYVTCLDGAYYEETIHAETIWADSVGTIWIESSHLGSPTSWAEEEYGGRGAKLVMDLNIDYRHLTLSQIRARLKVLPKLFQRIEGYMRIAREVSQKSGISIELAFDAKADIGWFLYRARIAPKGASELEGGIRDAVAVMKQVYDLTEGVRYRDFLSKS